MRYADCDRARDFRVSDFRVSDCRVACSKGKDAVLPCSGIAERALERALASLAKVGIFLVLLVIAVVIITNPEMDQTTGWFLRILFAALALIPDTGTNDWADWDDWESWKKLHAEA